MTTEPTQPTSTCPDCHAVVDDLAAHTRWHARLVHDLATAVTHELRRTTAGG